MILLFVPVNCRAYAAGVSPPKDLFGLSSLYSKGHASMIVRAFPIATNSAFRHHRNRLMRSVVDHGQAFDHSTFGRSVKHKIH
jgi:hypothetical protein